jgi:hypothetical protein
MRTPNQSYVTKLILAKTNNEEIPNSDTNACYGDLPAQHITIRYIRKENLRWEVTVTSGRTI